MINHMISYFIYARKSTESEDRQALSIDSQVNELRQLAQKDHLKIKKVFTESKSAKKSGRPIFRKMLKELKQNKITGILCWKLDRLTRNLLDGATISDLLENGIINEIRTPMQVYRNNSIDRLMSGIDILFARKYIDDLSENVKRGLKTKVQMGWMPGKAPMGYLNGPEEKGSKTILPDEVRFKLIRKMWDLMLSGNYSVPQISRIANNQWGFKTRRSRKMESVPLARSCLYRIFTNPFYYGQFYFQGELHRGKHKPMVTFEEFEQVQYLLGKKGKPKPEKHIFAFTGIFRCGLCGAMITAENKFKYIKSTNQTKKYIYYHCTYGKDPNCPRQSITEENLIQQVDEYLKAITIPQEYLKWIFKYYDSVQSKELNKTENEKQSIRKELANLEVKLQNLMNLKISPENGDNQIISDAEYLNQKNKLMLEKTRLQNSLNNYSKTNKQLIEVTKDTFEFSVYARKWFQNGDIQCRRTILSKIFSNQVITNKKVLIIAKKPFVIISKLQLPVDMAINTFEPVNFSLGKTKNTALGGVSPSWLRQLDELGTELKRIVYEKHSS